MTTNLADSGCYAMKTENKSNKPIRILHIVSTMDFGGVETLLMEIYRNIDRTKIQFDFLCHNTDEGKYVDEIKSMGGRVFFIKSVVRSGGIINYLRKYRKFLKNHGEYKIVHCHVNRMNGLLLYGAKKQGIPSRISHSHIAKISTSLSARDYYYPLSIRLINPNATDYFACSKDAAEFLYKDEDTVKKSIIFNNAINTDKFRFDANARAKLRSQMGWEDKTVFAHTGRFMDQKNHTFLIDIFNEISKLKSDAILLLLGDGPLKPSITEKVHSLGLDDKVIFAGSHPNINDYMSASDAFIFPSLFEGLGIVAVEAQCSGIPVFASDKVPEEAKRTDLLEFISLETSASEWAKQIISRVDSIDKSEENRLKYANAVKESGYDIKEKAKWLENFYIRRYNESVIK